MENKITGNEPINAVIESWRDENPEILVCNDKGLTIRQHFAAMAMQGLLYQNLPVDRALNEKNNSQVIAVAESAVKMADALIAELNK